MYRFHESTVEWVQTHDDIIIPDAKKHSKCNCNIATLGLDSILHL